MEFLLLFHGLIVLFACVTAGFAFSKAIRHQPESEVAWRVVHSGGSMGGIMLMAFSAVWGKLNLNDWSFYLGYGLLISTYLLVLGMFIAALTGKRGLNSQAQGIEKLVFICYGVGGTLSTVSLGGIIIFLGFS
jgi:uncharacterized membrane protein